MWSLPITIGPSPSSSTVSISNPTERTIAGNLFTNARHSKELEPRHVYVPPNLGSKPGRGKAQPVKLIVPVTRAFKNDSYTPGATEYGGRGGMRREGQQTCLCLKAAHMIADSSPKESLPTMPAGEALYPPMTLSSSSSVAAKSLESHAL